MEEAKAAGETTLGDMGCHCQKYLELIIYYDLNEDLAKLLAPTCEVPLDEETKCSRKAKVVNATCKKNTEEGKGCFFCLECLEGYAFFSYF